MAREIESGRLLEETPAVKRKFRGGGGFEGFLDHNPLFFAGGNFLIKQCLFK